MSRIGALGRTVLAAAAVVAAFAASGARAGLEEDYRAGERAFRAGDLVAASTLLRRAADAGHAPSQVLLAGILDQAEFDEEAVAWYRKAAGQGNADGEYGLGTMYMSGEGVKADPAEAYRWFTRAADRGHELATVALANATLKGPKGEPAPDAARAAEWLQKAAAFDHLASLDALAAAYQSGEYGIVPDAAKAKEHAERASAIRRKMTVEKAKKGKR